jgi:cytochrome b561
MIDDPATQNGVGGIGGAQCFMGNDGFSSSPTVSFYQVNSKGKTSSGASLRTMWADSDAAASTLTPTFGPCSAVTEKTASVVGSVTTISWVYDVTGGCLNTGFGCTVVGTGLNCTTSQLVWAHGQSGEKYAYHGSNKGTLTINDFFNYIPEPTPAPTPALPGRQIQLGATTLKYGSEGNKLTFVATLPAEKYFAIGFNSGGAMIGGNAIIANPKSNGISVYKLTDKEVSGVSKDAACTAKISDGSIEVQDGTTTALFSIDLATMADCFPSGLGCQAVGGSVQCSDSQMIWASGDSTASTLSEHDERGTVKINFVTGESKSPAIKSGFVAHAVLMGLSWGFMLPSGVITARFMKDQPWQPGTWFKMHRAMQVSGLLLAMVAFFVIIVTMSEIGSQHFGGSNASHKIIGLAVMLLGVQQPFLACFRPHPPEAGVAKTTTRFAWEVCHKGLGYLAVLLGMLNVLGGLAILGKMYPDKNINPGKAVYGTVIAVLVGTFVVLQARQSMLKPHGTNVSADSPVELKEALEDGNQNPKNSSLTF